MVQETERLAALVRAEALLDTLYSLLDRATQEVLLAGGKPADGCNGCCRSRTPVAMRIEALNVRSSVGQLPRGTGRLRDEALDWLTYPNGALTLKSAPPPDKGDPAYRHQLVEEVKVASRLTCPFRDPGGPCYLHSARPLVCRAHDVTMVGPETTAFIGRDTELGRAIAAAYQALREHLEASDPSLLDTSFLPTHLARDLAPSAVENGDHARRAIPHAKLFTFNRPIDLFMGQP